MFVDRVTLELAAGRGGDGAISFLRAFRKPKGGPDGGDGGDGGSVVLRVASGRMTLRDINRRRHYKAESGRPGAGQNRTGRKGKDVVLEVPIGTLVFDDANDELVVDFLCATVESATSERAMASESRLSSRLPYRTMLMLLSSLCDVARSAAAGGSVDKSKDSSRAGEDPSELRALIAAAAESGDYAQVSELTSTLMQLEELEMARKRATARLREPIPGLLRLLKQLRDEQEGS